MGLSALNDGGVGIFAFSYEPETPGTISSRSDDPDHWGSRSLERLIHATIR